MSSKERMFQVGKSLREGINNMEGYLTFIDRLAEVNIDVVRSRKQEDIQSIEDWEKVIKDSFEEFMKCLAEEKARIQKL